MYSSRYRTCLLGKAFSLCIIICKNNSEFRSAPSHFSYCESGYKWSLWNSLNTNPYLIDKVKEERVQISAIVQGKPRVLNELGGISLWKIIYKCTRQNVTQKTLRIGAVIQTNTGTGIAHHLIHLVHQFFIFPAPVCGSFLYLRTWKY